MYSIRCSRQLLTKLAFSRLISQKCSNMKFTGIRPVGAEIFHAVRQTDRHMMKLIVAFRNFVSAPKNLCLSITGQSIYVIIMIQNET